jgi:radical SAM superfamily enzyme YgiQ (UPF0313 family)
MKLLLIRPRPEKETIGLQHLMIVEPLELEILGATIRKNDTAVITDMILEKEPVEYFLSLHKPDIICVTGYITNVGTIRNICRIAKQFNPDIITIVGGVHCEVCPEDFDDGTIDFRVVRNAVTIFPQLLEHIESRKDMPNGVLVSGQKLQRDRLPEMDFNYIFPDRDLTADYRDQYFYIFHYRVALLKATFGCPFQCNFCFCRKITEEKYWQRPVGNVIKELESIDEKEIYIVDDDFLADQNYVLEFIDELEKRNIQKNYLIYGRADFIAKNPDLISRFRDCGLKTVIVGFESFFEEELKSYNKSIDVETNLKAINILNSLKIDCYATIILSPEWNRQQFRKLEQIIKQVKIHYVNLQPLTPLPGTDFKIQTERLVFNIDDYPKWDLAHISIIPSKLSIAEYYKELLRLYGKIIFQP